MSDNVLVIGSGGREHCLAWKLSQSEHVGKIYLAPGNGAAAEGNTNISLEKTQNVASINVAEHSTVKAFCLQAKVDLVIVGPEAPLAEGIVDFLTDSGIPCFGPTKSAARIETSKAFAKEFMTRHNIPTARWQAFTDCESACQHIRTTSYPALVVKASGLAAGKGVIVAENTDEAENAVVNMLERNAFGEAGSTIVIEEKLDGSEISVLAFSDGKNIAVMPPAQDHKRAYDGDLGPNTGGMGAYAPCNEVSTAELQFIVDNIIQKAVDGMNKDGCPFVGILFAGIMLTSQGPKVLEFNCRFGDPETQVILPLMKSDLYATIMEAVSGDLSSAIPSWHHHLAAVGVVMSSGGYPGQYKKGFPITGAEKFKSQDVVVFQAGTRFDSDMKELVTSGGRVLCAVGVSSTLKDAQRKAYQAVKQIHFENAHYRNDIAQKAFGKVTMTYSDAGVNIDSGNQLIHEIKPLARSTQRSGCLGDLGGFGGLFDLKEIGYEDPILVSGTDGVGTKLKIAQSCDLHSTIGIDLVAMCVNDILAHGAEPLFFLDYFATAKLEVSVAKQVIEGVASGCKMAGCALLGGETAEMPGMYTAGEYDLAGFAVGAVERHSLLPQKDMITPGDVVIGLASSGLHSNGYSLVRKVLEARGLALDSPCPFDSGRSLGEVLLTPTKIYVKSVLPLMKVGNVKAFVHVTGGGLLENIPRVLPEHLGVSLDAGLWTIPPVFGWISQAGNIKPGEMLRTFNCGLGAVLICENEDSLTVLKHLQDHSEQANIIGVIQEKQNSDSVVIEAFSQKLQACCPQDMFVNGIRHKKRSRVGVLISGSGTNLQALINHAAKPESSAEIVLVISNVDNVQGLTRARKAGIPTVVINHKNFSSRTDFDMALNKALEISDVEFVCLAGFMRILTGGFVNKWRGRMLNTHPSLLPSFKGMHAHRDVLDAGVKVSGCTVHFVAEEVDAGAIVAQEAVAVLPNDTVEMLQERVKKAEHVCYPQAMELLASGQIILGDDGRVQYQW